MPFINDLTPDDCQIILTALLEIPAKHSYKTLRKVEQQFMAQGLIPADIPVPPAQPLPDVPTE